ncbi:MAG: single-stranded-DNA-specific exonuclease RecJ [Pseudomonadales bacterium]|nr:single-stranded-DNA-specific exonuclease RecJ [Pseudomonadales bacterium]
MAKFQTARQYLPRPQSLADHSALYTKTLAGEPYALPDFMQQICYSREVCQPQDLAMSLSQLQDPFTLKGMHAAIARLEQAYQQQQSILIVGDFDADGATSTALMLQGLAVLGFSHVDYCVPDRFIYGYGLSTEIVTSIADDAAKPDLIITVDNGIASVEGVNLAKQLGIDVLITDHHLVGKTLPDAVAIINPNQPDCQFQYKHLAGVGVAFHLLMAIRMRWRQSGLFDADSLVEPNLAQFLYLVALGTVADVVKIDGYNQVLVQQGLIRMRNNVINEGLRALIRLCNIDQRYLSSTDIAFKLAPRINAAGRLDDMRHGIELLRCADADTATQLAAELDHTNQRRKQIEKTMRAEADAELEQITAVTAEQLPRCLCLYQENWHQGVVGLIASRLKSQYYRPVIAFAPVYDADQQLISLKGSGRSIEGIHLRDMLDQLATQRPSLINKFGGHAMAAGLSIQPEDFAEFSQQFDRMLSAFDQSLFTEQCFYDAKLAPEDLTLEHALTLEQLLPWGQGLPEPLFYGEFEVLSISILSAQHIKASVRLEQQSFELMDFFADLEFWQQLDSSATKVAAVYYRMAVNRFRGAQRLQLIVEDILPLALGNIQ